MKPAPNHTVRRLVLEFSGIAESDSPQFQEEISDLFQKRILPLLDKYFSEHSPDESIHRIESLELDLGTISRTDLEKDLVETVSRRLEIYFQPSAPSGSDFIAEKEIEKSKESIEKISAEKSHLELFRFFVETGNLPWWADSEIADPVGESLDYLIRNDEYALRHLLYKQADRPDFFKRIVIQLGFPKWAQLAAINTDRAAAELISMLSPLIDSFAETATLSDYPKHKLREIFGLKFLSQVFLAPHKIRITKDFRRGFLTQLIAGQSAKHNDKLVELFTQFEKNAQEKSDRQKPKSDPDVFLWKNKAPRGSLQENLFEQIKRLLKTETFDSERKAEWLERLQKLNNQVFANEDLQKITQMLEREITAPEKTEIRVEKDSENAPPAKKKSERGEVFKAVKKEKDRFSDTDELYIGNAGLVILYPFLTRFFENLKLVEDRRFVSEAAAHRAVGLLQFLADGQEIPAEYRCGLNKILCGLETETVLEFGEPITPEEAEACENLLEAVIANAPILGEMTIQGFRGSFLMRKGILRAVLGAWQLSVERETYDIVLERFPWNWNIVKLPWMKWAISTEWI